MSNKNDDDDDDNDKNNNNKDDDGFLLMVSRALKKPYFEKILRATASSVDETGERNHPVPKITHIRKKREPS